MGGLLISRSSTGRTVAEAFAKLQAEDLREKGDDYYSGSFNSCTLATSSEKDTEALMGLDDMGKGTAYWATVRKAVPNKNKIKTAVVNIPAKGTRVWKTVFAIYEKAGYFSAIHCADRDNQVSAIAYARELQETSPESSFEVRIHKKLTSHTDTVAKIKYKPSNAEADGEWVFRAVAPY